ncbi:DHS-like NAD/FAD-binding domain-containing protein [Lophiostoma macrostomum CBS 122681]|uniref:protein acetyllysine N-acetyltransferase n=1 Tax=Lophiostoma macrostomum CBS 122681 TaxID=1314788 RepID=A0A6A6SU62_9PLEO|nr:DHS-like NAD/FAD-binding domain-containing protein [Lophiostoma macrostomum CBS 122681]
MDLTAPAIAEEERFDPPSKITTIATHLATQIKNGSHFIVFTGAGISTSTGIPDFRGPEGAWTKRAQGKQLAFKPNTTLQAIPSPTHMALVALQDRGLLQYVVSQNCDGLHRRSGIRPDRIAELHGNSNLEYCMACGKEYLRDFRAVARYEKSWADHRTGRKCAVPGCGGALRDSIVNFGEGLPGQAFADAERHARMADCCLVLGSSCRVTPANEIPEIVGAKGRGKKKAGLAICNLQSTPLDGAAALRVYARTDELMISIMQKLDIPIPRFVLRRRLVVEVVSQAADRHQVKVGGLDVDGTPVSFLKSVRLVGSRRAARTEPFVISTRETLGLGEDIKLELEFFGHYGEPDLVVRHEYTGGKEGRKVYLLEYDPMVREWRIGEEE